MAFRSSQVTVGVSATELFEAAAGDVEVWVNVDPNSQWWIGGSDVDTTKGLPLFGPNSGGIFNSRIRPGDKLFGVVSSGTITANVLIRSA